MSFEDISQSFTQIQKELSNQINLRTQLAGLLLSRKMAGIASQLITMLIIAGLFSMILLFLSFAFVFWYGEQVGTYYHGFLMISLVYTLLGVVVYLNRKKLFLDPIVKKMNEKGHLAIKNEENPEIEINSIEDLNRQTELTRLRIQFSDITLEQQWQKMGNELSPSRLINKWLERSWLSSDFLIKLLEITINLLRKK